MNVIEDGDATRATADSNRRTIARFTGARSLGVLPFVAASERGNWDHLGALAAKHLALDAII